MADHTITISCDGPSPETTNVGHTDKVTFDNTTGAEVTITFTGTGVFNPSPGGSTTIEKDKSKTLTVGNTNGEQDFSYPECDDELGTRNGKIKVS
jgi:hypothetical protein